MCETRGGLCARMDGTYLIGQPDAAVSGVHSYSFPTMTWHTYPHLYNNTYRSDRTKYNTSRSHERIQTA
eukprot:2732901-Ditylum_brightwellii.AAC.2